MVGENYHFIVSDGPKLREDQAVRTLIRKQAMKGPALERKKRNIRNRSNANRDSTQVKLAQVSNRTVSDGAGKQCPEQLDQDDEVRSDSSNEITPTGSTHSDEAVTPLQTSTVAWKGRLFPTGSAISPYLHSSYEAARSKFQVDVTDLAMLTDFNVGRGTNSVLAADPTRLITLLGHSKWSYLQYVPSHYATSHCLTAATDCVLAKTRGILMPHKADQSLELRLYTKALRSLQIALDDSAACLRSDVLCATQLLSLHELLTFTRDSAWNHHIHGSVRIVKHRASKRFETDFDKALFVAHIGPIVFDSLVNNKHCYLEDPQWLELYKSMAQITNHLTDRSPLAIGIRCQMFTIPGLWNDVDRCVTGPDLFDNEAIAVLEGRCHKVHEALLDWMEDYKTYCVRASLKMPSAQDIAMRRELLGIGVECLCVVKRLLMTTNDKNREQLEQEAQAAARSILVLQDQDSPKYSWLFTGHEVGIAHSVISTKEDWEAPYTYASEYEVKIASRARYVNWSCMLRSGGD